jgi:hypothetical protein
LLISLYITNLSEQIHTRNSRIYVRFYVRLYDWSATAIFLRGKGLEFAYWARAVPNLSVCAQETYFRLIVHLTHACNVGQSARCHIVELQPFPECSERCFSCPEIRFCGHCHSPGTTAQAARVIDLNAPCSCDGLTQPISGTRRIRPAAQLA